MSEPLDPYSRPNDASAYPGAVGPSPYTPPTGEERNWAMAGHLGSFVAAWLALGLLAPLLVMLTKGNKSNYVRRHAVESLNFQLSWLIYTVLGGITAFLLAIVTLGLGLIVIVPLIAVFLLTYAVLVIVGGVKASQGAEFRYPLTIRLVS
ncbi:MAG: DUF4870 domain-containing protein [Actinomycetota bacterium]|nr:DUF4870 domain-containing protein [Actinomycetota bacterium]